MSVFIYNPLARGSILHDTWSASAGRSARPLAPDADAGLVERYLRHLAETSADRKTRPLSVSAYVDASRPIVRDLRALLDEVTLNPPFDDLQSTSGIGLYFPVLNQFDARAVEAGNHRAVFISSRCLDAIEFFAHCVQQWSLLNSYLSDRSLPNADWPPAPYAWIPFLVNDGYVDLDELPVGYIHYHDGLTSNFLRGMKTLVDAPQTRMGSIAEAGLDALSDNREHVIQARYLAAVTLLFVYLHECVHLLLAHNELVPYLTPHARLMEEVIDKYIEKTNEDAGSVVAQRLWSKDSSLQFSLEMAADFYAVRSTIAAQCGDIILEAASLWYTALGTCRNGGADVFDALKESTGDAHPPYPTRVWALNGSLSTGTRQGHVARAVRRAAEGMAGAAAQFGPEPENTRVSAGPRGSTRVMAGLRNLIKPRTR